MSLWSNEMQRFIIGRMAMASPSTTTRFTMRSMASIAACGWLMIGAASTVPSAPVLLSVNVPPWISSIFRELVGMDKPDDRMVLEGRPEVLPDGDNVNIVASKVPKHFLHFINLLTETDHDA